MYENGIQLWFGFAGIDTRQAPRQITNNTAPPPPVPTLRRTISDTYRNRIENTPGYAIEDIPRERRYIRTRSNTTMRQRRRQRSKSRKKKKNLTNLAQGSRRQGDSTFSGFLGGKRRKRKSRKRRSKLKSKKRRRKRKTKKRKK